MAGTSEATARKTPSRLRGYLKSIANRLLLRDMMVQTWWDVSKLSARMERIEQSGDLSLQLIEKKLDYLMAKLDAYAEAEDRNKAAFRDNLQAGMNGVDARLAAIEKHNSELTSEVAALREAGQEAGRQRQSVETRLAALETGNTELAEALASIEAAQGKAVDTVKKSVNFAADKLSKEVTRTAFNEFQQREALDALRQLLKFELPLPATRSWAASPDFLLQLYRHIIARRPKTVVELGSGVTTLVAAAALAANGDGGRLYSLDHEATFAEKTAKLIAEHGLSGIAIIHHAPLQPWRPARPTELGEEWQWYAVPRELDGLDGIELLIVDGPPGAIGPFARYPAVPHFRARMAPGCTIFLDDAQRSDEKTAAEAWAEEAKLNLDLNLKSKEYEKGAAILTVEDAAAGV